MLKVQVSIILSFRKSCKKLIIYFDLKLPPEMFWFPAYKLKIIYELNNKYMHNEI